MPEEPAIIARAIDDPAAFAPIYEHYVDAIYGFCQNRVSDPELAADLTSQIFIKAISALPRYQAQTNQTSFRSWLFTIARNVVIDHHRTSNPHRSITDPDAPIDLRDPAQSPEDHALTADLRRSLQVAMATLTDGQRHIVELRLAGLTGPEIADVLGMHIAAVKSLQFRAYSKLRDLLHDQFISEFSGETPS
jgi:RNA polymerase sigma-70 factor (ECF subfamily)